MFARQAWVFPASLAASLLLHLALLAGGGFSRPLWQPGDSRPLTVTMQSFALDAPAAPVVEQAPPPSIPTPPATEQTPPAAPAQSLAQTPSANTTQSGVADSADAVTGQTAAEEMPADASSARVEPAASEPLYLPDGSLNGANPEAWKIFARKTDITRKPYAQDLDQAVIPPPAGAPIRVKKAYEVIAPPADARPSFPKEAQLRYQGPLGITGVMDFHRDAHSYRIDTTFNIPFNKMRFVSEGKIENNRLIPLKYSDTRKGKVYASAIFDYDGQRVRFGKGETPAQSAPIDGVQHDFFSWAWQMSIDGGYIPGQIQLTNGKNVYLQDAPPAADVDMEESLYDTGEGKIRIVTQKIDRERKDRHDTIAYGFAPDFANIPALIVFNNNGTEYQMQIIGIRLDGKNYWQAMRRVSQER